MLSLLLCSCGLWLDMPSLANATKDGDEDDAAEQEME